MKKLLIVVLLLTNIAWALAYRSLWYDAAQAEGLLSEAEHYIDSTR